MPDSPIRVGFYLPNAPIAEVDVSRPDLGNPGIGGTHYSLIAVPFYLKKYAGGQIEPIVLANETKHLPKGLAVMQANSLAEALRMAAGKCDVFVFWPRKQDFNPEARKIIDSLGIKCIGWAHISPNRNVLDAFAESAHLARLVCVGREELDSIRDHPAIYKSVCIYNGIVTGAYRPEDHVVGDGSTVVYLGSLTPINGFHRLARIWKKVIARVPEARLFVIGSGKLYNRDNELGKWGIAAEGYERDFIRPYLSGTNGEPLPSVHFLGTLGSEKIPILQQADVGVVSPSEAVQTFCIGAVEFQASGTPVVSMALGGLLDTVVHRQTGLLIHTDRDLVDAIVSLLRKVPLRRTYGLRAMEHAKAFDFAEVTQKWIELIKEVADGVPGRLPPIKSNLLHNDKYLREMLRVLKGKYPALGQIPPLIAVGKKGLPRQVWRAVLGRGK